MGNSNLIRCQNGHMFSARRYGTVCPYCNIETATKEKEETGYSEEAVEELLFLQEMNPVCGWLVCISGPRQGKDYRIKSGKNFIGRADDMDIQILGIIKFPEGIMELSCSTRRKGRQSCFRETATVLCT